jgi:peptidoglycan/LPS O-acetylase OafA/YrhL
LRAVAIIPVILFHLGFAWLPGGFLGVDVFFVISGFLISSMISADLDRGTFKFGKFWVRRVRRIVPALLCTVLVTLLAARYLVTPVTLASIARDALSAGLSYANVRMFSKFGNYWGPAAESSPFLHAWSLSVEEQFYLVFPLFLALLARLRVRRSVALAAATLVGFVAFVVMARRAPTFTFYMLPTRAWELLVGALTAALAPRIAPRTAPQLQGFASVAGLGLIAVSLFGANGQQGINAWVVVPVVGAAIVLAYSEGGSWANAALGSWPCVFVGKISYSLYLWHWVAITLADLLELRSGHPVTLPWLIAAIAVCSLASHYLVEKPARAWSKGAWLAAALLLLVTGVSVADIRRAQDPNLAGAFNPVVCYSAYYDATPKKDAAAQLSRVNPNDAALGAWAGVIGKLPNPAFVDAWKNGGIPGGVRRYGERADVLLIGDSHGCMWGQTVDEIATELGLAAAFFTFDGNVPYFPIPVRHQAPHGPGFDANTFKEFSQKLLQNIDHWHPRVVILASRWETKTARDFRNLEQLALYSTNAGAHVLFIDSPPRLPWENDSTTQALVLRGFKPREGQAQYLEAKQAARFDHGRESLKEVASRIPGARVMDVYPALYRDGKAQVLDGADVLYLDDDHLSYHGTSLFKAKLREELASLSKR